MANCAHGFPSDQCLICRTLGSNAPGGNAAVAGPGLSRRKAAKAARVAEAAPASDLALVLSTPTANLPRRQQGSTTMTPDAARADGSRRRGGFWPVIAALLIGGVLVWAFAGIVSLAFHIAEYVALAAAAGWVGYRAGYARGRHRRD